MVEPKEPVPPVIITVLPEKTLRKLLLVNMSILAGWAYL